MRPGAREREARRAQSLRAQRMGRAVAVRVVRFEPPEKKVEKKWMGAQECRRRREGSQKVQEELAWVGENAQHCWKWKAAPGEAWSGF